MGWSEKETILGLSGKDTKNELENQMEELGVEVEKL